MNLIKILILVLIPTSWALEPNDSLSFFFEGKEASIPMAIYKGSQVSADCIKTSESCQAIKILNGKSVKFAKDKSGSLALDYCKAVEATPVLLKNKKDEQIAFCLFEDVSFINAWDLYHKHWGEK